MAAEVVEAGVLMALIVAVSTLIYATGVLTNGGPNRDNGVSLTVSVAVIVEDGILGSGGVKNFTSAAG